MTGISSITGIPLLSAPSRSPLLMVKLIPTPGGLEKCVSIVLEMFAVSSLAGTGFGLHSFSTC